jgi:hypothetical protein
MPQVMGSARRSTGSANVGCGAELKGESRTKTKPFDNRDLPTRTKAVGNLVCARSSLLIVAAAVVPPTLFFARVKGR